jgi:hypothetical protein
MNKPTRWIEYALSVAVTIVMLTWLGIMIARVLLP